MNLKLLTSSQIILALALVSCGPPRPYQPDYMVNAAVVCDYDYRTPILADDCDRLTGYYYHPGIYGLYWRPIGSPAVIVYNNYRLYGSSYSPGGSIRLNEPIATTATGQPVRDKRGKVRTGPKGSNYNQTPLSSAPKPSSSYTPTVAKPTAAKPASSTASTQSNSPKSNSPKSSSTPSSTPKSSTPQPTQTRKPSPPVRSSNSESFSKSPGSSSSSTGSSSTGSYSTGSSSTGSYSTGSSSSSSGSKRSAPSKSSGSSFSSSKSSGG